MKNVEKTNRRLPYRARMMIGGVRKSKSYATKEAALAQVNVWKAEATGMVSSDELAELVLCRKRLAGKGTLSEAVDFFLRHNSSVEAPPIREGALEFFEWLESSGRSHEHVRSVRTHLRCFLGEFGLRQPSEVSVSGLSEWVRKRVSAGGKSARTQKNEINAARNFLGWAKLQGWLRAVPEIDERLMPRLEVKEPEIYTAAETAALFLWLEQNAPSAIPFFAVRAFLGLRTSEAERLTWEDVDLGAKMLRVRAKKSKLGTARTLDEELAPGTAFVWLEKYREFGFSVGKSLLKRISLHMSLKKNAFRKSFATMLTSLRKNQQETMLATGHTSMQTLKKHYEGAKQSRSEAAAYFGVLPRLR